MTSHSSASAALQPMRWVSRIIVLAGILWIAGFMLFVESIEAERPSSTPRADGIVVLTGGAERIGDGIRLLEDKKGDRLFISGVNVQVSVDQLQRTWPGHDAAFACCIDLDFRARNTIENALESAEWVKRNRFGSIILVTASFHLPRARLEFSAAIPGLIIVPYPVVPDQSRIERWWSDAAMVKLLAGEYSKFLIANLRVRLPVS
ncbi:COG1434 Uncharacterized conserved protein [Rhabdaerophilaceae bacterium]